ncbi:MAG TPA: prepilin-type N-terminal cleavage/methylation domain-containing protein [Symbiobacteriaceae bacterium]|nr:prepilin-type N-terminal cleavage/methylation domain-containing protein [Symbiobacteriaceae bacterium]
MNRIAQLRRSQEGFTLIELLVVVAIIALLATFAVPKLFDAINKSKKAPGQADMQTISGGLERFYLESDNGVYPTGTAAQVEAALKAGFLKSSTTFLNGFKQPYLYGTTTAGAGYVLIDLQGSGPSATAGGTVTVNCGAGPTAYTFTVPASATGLVVNASIASADISTCVAPTGAAIIKN